MYIVQLNNNATALWSLELSVTNEDIMNMKLLHAKLPKSKGYPGCTCTDSFTTVTSGSGLLAAQLLATIAVLVVLQVATIIALISTCVVFKRKLKQR